MSKETFEDASEALRGFLPREYRDFRAHAGPANLKVWFASWHEHYEIQRLSRAVLRSAGIANMPAAVEVGFHSEHPRPRDNDAALEMITTQPLRKALGHDAVAGPFVGRKDVRDRWRRVSELWDAADLDDDGLVFDAAERLATYITTIEPALKHAHANACACWKQS